MLMIMVYLPFWNFIGSVGAGSSSATFYSSTVTFVPTFT